MTLGIHSSLKLFWQGCFGSIKTSLDFIRKHVYANFEKDILARCLRKRSKGRCDSLLPDWGANNSHRKLFGVFRSAVHYMKACVCYTADAFFYIWERRDMLQVDLF